MKRCPECRRDYTDETLNFCLDDGTALLDGPASMDEPATAIISPHETEPATINFPNTTAENVEGPNPPQTKTSHRTLIVVGIGVIVLIAALGIVGYLYYERSSPRQV